MLNLCHKRWPTEWQVPIERSNEAYQKRGKCLKEIKTLQKARENASDQVAFGFFFASDWFRRWH